MGLDPNSLPQAFKSKMASQPTKLVPGVGTITKVSQSPLDKLNKTERRLYDLLMASNRFTEVIPHGITFHLGHDLHYTPDFVCLGELKALVVECKGAFIFARALNKFKVCSLKFNCFIFELHEWKESSWHITKYS